MRTQTSTDTEMVSPYLPDHLPAGVKAGPWTVEKELGRGGMGTVYGVVHDGIGKRAALKVIHKKLLQPHHIERMLIEARVVNRVGHPNIVDIFETGTLPDGRPYIVMERLDGESLAARVARGQLPPIDVIQIVLQVCSALIAAHDVGVIHRDLKTDNVFLVEHAAGEPLKTKLLDWGIAKELACDVRHTSEGHVVGTPQYLAPEQARAGVVSDRTDVYSLGVLAYELLLHQLPFEAETPLEIMTMHLRAVPPPPRELWPEIPVQLEALLLAMLAKDPTKRPSMRGVASELEAIRDAMIAGGTGPIGRTSAPRIATPVELAATQAADDAESESVSIDASPPARRLHRAQKWQYGLGAAAVAVLAAMFAITRSSDSAAAAESASISATAGDLVAPRAAELAAATPTPAPQLLPNAQPQTQPSLQAQPTVASPDPAPLLTTALLTTTPAPRGHASPAPAATGAAAKPRATATRGGARPRFSTILPAGSRRIDPNGTLAAY